MATGARAGPHRSKYVDIFYCLPEHIHRELDHKEAKKQPGQEAAVTWDARLTAAA